MSLRRAARRRAAAPAAAGVDAVKDEFNDTADKAHYRGNIGEDHEPGLPVIALEVWEVPAGQHDDETGAPEGSVHVREQLVDDADPAKRSAAREDTSNDHEHTPEETVYPQ